MRTALYCLACLLMVAGASAADTWTLFNPTGLPYQQELVRLRLDVPADIAPARYAVLDGDTEVPYQVEERDGKRDVWVCTDLGAKEERTYRIARRAAADVAAKVTVRREGDVWVLDNGLVAARVPAVAAGDIPTPVLQVRLPNGQWVGKGAWHTERALVRFTATVTASGPLFARVSLRYDFRGMAGQGGNAPAFATADVTLVPGRPHVVLEESHEMPRDSYWEFDAAAGWAPRHALTIPHFGGFDRKDQLDENGKPYPWPPQSLKAGQTRMGDTLLNLIPRWSQAYDDGWWFAANDGTHAVGAAPVRAGRWFWPHDNMIEIKVKPTADYAGFRCPTWRGKRMWYLLAGPNAAWQTPAACGEYVIRTSLEGLDKLHSEYILDWPGLKAPTNPDGTPRQVPADYFSPAGKYGHRSKPCFGWGGGGGSLNGPDNPMHTLAVMQTLYDPDTFGDYWRYFSPENPNFATSWWAGIFWQGAKLKDHPRFPDLAKLAEMKLREDLYHSVTMPGGAGQECPGYMAGAVSGTRKMAAFCKEQFGFDLTGAPELKASASFLWRLSYPMGDGGRRSHPAGDTHPPGPNVYAGARDEGVLDDATKHVTEELPGFGVAFRNRPQTPWEQYLAFKSGPNRGHFHGDQLAFHYCAFGRPLLVDHHCSYGPRAGAEHMHNRVAFHTDALPYANMDGYERLIALKTSPTVDVAMGQVESDRLRITNPFPPETWDTSLPEERFDTPLRYRRTVVQVKGGARDYVVIRDQNAGPDVFATYCLHAYGATCVQRGNAFEFDGLTVHVAAPAAFGVSRHDWQHMNGGLEATKGLRLTTKGRSGEFITVLMPKAVAIGPVLRFTLAGALVRADGTRADLVVTCPARDGKPLAGGVGLLALDYSIGVHSGTAAVTDEAVVITTAIGGDRGQKGGAGAFTLALKAADGYAGAYAGTFAGKPVAGLVTAEALPEGFVPSAGYLPDAGPRVEAIPGGVRVGEDEIVFAGGIDDADATTYTTVTRAGKPLLALTGRDIDMDRPQGEIGLFVPDAGYPFGDIPDWLLRQRASKKPEWFVEMWPLTEHTVMPPAGR